MDVERLKLEAAREGARRVVPGQVIGLGSGSTAELFLDALAERLRRGELDRVRGVPTSDATERRARSLGIPLTTLDEDPSLDLTVDGADEVDPDLNLLKGRGGALLREKIVARASARRVIIVDENKRVPRLGAKHPVPVEVLPFGWKAVEARIRDLGGTPVLRKSGSDPIRTDQENYLLDCRFGPIADPVGLARRLEGIPGVLGHGLFLGMADEVIVATGSGIEVLRPGPDR